MRSRKEDNLVRRQLWLEQCAWANRRVMTISELRLWSALKARQLGVQFRREVPLLTCAHKREHVPSINSASCSEAESSRRHHLPAICRTARASRTVRLIWGRSQGPRRNSKIARAARASPAERVTAIAFSAEVAAQEQAPFARDRLSPRTRAGEATRTSTERRSVGVTTRMGSARCHVSAGYCDRCVRRSRSPNPVWRLQLTYTANGELKTKTSSSSGAATLCEYDRWAICSPSDCLAAP